LSEETLQIDGKRSERQRRKGKINPSEGREYNQSDFDIAHLVMSMGRVILSVVGRGCLL